MVTNQWVSATEKITSASDLVHWISDHCHFKSFLSYHKDDLDQKQIDIVSWKSNHNNFVVAEITFRVAVITSSVTKIIL